MMKRRFMAVMLAAVLITTCISGCGGGDNEPAADTSNQTVDEETTDVETDKMSDDETYDVGYIVSNMSHEWYQNICSGAERRAKEKNINLSISDAAMDSSKQISYAENYISQGVDAMIITPVDPSALSSVTMLAEEAGIPLIAESSKFDGMDSFVGITDFDAAEHIGEWMAQYAADNEIDMKILIVGQPIYEACRDRVDGFLSGLDKGGAEYVIAQEVDGNGTKEDSLAVATDALTAHPDVNVIFGINDNSSTGAMNAYLEHGLDESALTVLGFGFEGSVGRDALLSDSPYKAAVAMFPDYVGAAIVDVAKMASAQENVPEMYSIPTTVITKDNFEDYYKDNGDGTYTTDFSAIDALLEK